MHKNLLLVLAGLAGSALANPDSSAAPASAPAAPAPVAVAAPAADSSSKPAAPGSRKIPFNLGFAPCVDINGCDSRDVENNVSIEVVMGEASRVRGMALAGAVSRTHGDIDGLQASGGLNMVGGDMHGLQLSAVNIVEGQAGGIQGAYLLNLVHGDAAGFQGSSLANLTRGEFRGLQLAGVANLANQPVKGAQISGLVNQARSITGLQDGFVNIGGQVRGAQIGFVNVGGQVRGAQIGFINVAREIHGAPIGFINIARNIDYRVQAWYDESGHSNVGMMYAGKHVYSMVTGTYGRPDQDAMGGIGFAVGARLPVEPFILDADLGSTMLVQDWKTHEVEGRHRGGRDHDEDVEVLDHNQLIRARVTLGRQILPRLAVFAGVSYNILLSNEDPQGDRYVMPYPENHWDVSDDVRMWPGFFAGIRI